MPRLFTALEIPAPIAFSLSLLRGGLPGARWIDPENYHITLRFIGDIDEPTADEVADALARVDRPRFDLSLDGLGAFGSRQAAFDLRRREGLAGAAGAAGGARAHHPADRARAGAAEIHAARDAGAAEGRRARPTSPPTWRCAAISARRPSRSAASCSSPRAPRRGGGPYVMEEAYPLAA